MNSSSRIYIVEDSYVIALHLKMMLENESYQVLGISDSGEMALKEIQELKPDLVLLDIMLAGEMDGVQLASVLKETTDIPFIYLSSLSDKKTIQRAKVTQPYGFLNKPFEEDKICNIIEMALFKARDDKRIKQSEINLRSAFNNTPVMIWSVDHSFKILTANETFIKHIEKKFGLKVIPNKTIIPEDYTDPELLKIRKLWMERYLYALDGHTTQISSSEDGKYYDFTISPMLKEGEITGVTIYAEDVSERVIREQEINECVRQIGELRLSALRSAMNPHFIFNTLNSIQYFIALQDRQKAMKYLSTFSKLVRSILTHSYTDKVQLKEELEMVKNYVELELVRFENQFEFSLDLDPNLLNEPIEIPPFIIQPYIEKAILHGLCKRTEKGKLEIKIYQDTDELNIEIRDNGIGRKASKDFYNKNERLRFGLSTIENRLKFGRNKGQVFVNDIEDQDNNCVGTFVLIKLELNDSILAGVPCHQKILN